MKSPSSLRSLITTAAWVLLTASTFAQAPAPGAGTPPGAPAAPKPLGSSEKSFLRSAPKSLWYLHEVANAAKSERLEPGPMRLRDTTIADTTKAFEALKALAAARGEKEPVAELVGSDKSDVDRLGKAKDEKFVKLWLELLTKESKKLDKDFESAGKSSQDADFKTFLTNNSPLVRGIATSAEAAEKAQQQAKKK